MNHRGGIEETPISRGTAMRGIDMKLYVRFKFVVGLIVFTTASFALPNLAHADWRAYCETHRVHMGWYANEQNAIDTGADHFDNYDDHPQTIYIQEGSLLESDGGIESSYNINY